MSDAPGSRDGPDDSDDDTRETFNPFSDDTPDGVVRTEDDDDGWRFELVDGDADTAVERPPLEPGSPSAENVFFVLVGVALTILLLLSAFIPLPFVS